MWWAMVPAAMLFFLILADKQLLGTIGDTVDLFQAQVGAKDLFRIGEEGTLKFIQQAVVQVKTAVLERVFDGGEADMPEIVANDNGVSVNPANTFNTGGINEKQHGPGGLILIGMGAAKTDLSVS